MTLTVSDVATWIENNIVWGIPLIILILTVGILLSIRLRGIQMSHLGESLKYMVKNDSEGKGEVSCSWRGNGMKCFWKYNSKCT